MLKYTWLDVVLSLSDEYANAFWERMQTDTETVQAALLATLTDLQKAQPEEYQALYAKFKPQVNHV